MVRLQATQVPIDVDALAEAARREPVTVMSGDREAFVVVEPEEFKRLKAALDRERRQAAGRRLLATIDTIGRRVAEQLTPEEIARLEREIVDED